MFVFDKDSKVEMITFSLTAPLLRNSMMGLSYILLISVILSTIFWHVDAHAAMM